LLLLGNNRSTRAPRSDKRDGAGELLNDGRQPITATGPAGTRFKQSKLINQQIDQAGGGAV
ncbi:MAG: hypothetical protein PHX53_15100, partial [Syntrophales bacterium]|nr:hypothetical protein [Syntrophales bacterium]